MERAFEIIRKKILLSLDNTKKESFIDWFNKIKKNNNIGDLQLIVNIAIDLKNNLVDKKSYKKIFENIEIENLSEFRYKFENSIKQLNCHIFSNYSSEEGEKQKYVRVLDIPTIVEHYINKTDDIPDSFTPNKINIAIEKLKYIYKGKEVSFELSGAPPREISWVQPLDEFNKLINNNNSNLTDLVCSNTGLIPNYTDYRNHLGYIEYPKKFSMKTHQPCAINSNWNVINNLYISYKQNKGNYGRTRTTIDDNINNRRKERVHNKIAQNPYYKYKLLYLGEIKNVKINISNIVDDALNRL